MIIKKRPLLTLATALKDIPREWLRWIEPKVKRVGSCWLWEGACDGDGEPVVSLQSPTTGKRVTQRVKRIVASLFWEMKRHYDVIHQCGNLNCINPAHFYVSALHHAQEDRGDLIAKKQRGIRDYEKRT